MFSNIINKLRCIKRAKDLREMKSAMGSIKCINGKIMMERIAFDNVIVFENEQGHIVIRPSDR